MAMVVVDQQWKPPEGHFLLIVHTTPGAGMAPPVPEPIEFTSDRLPAESFRNERRSVRGRSHQ